MNRQIYIELLQLVYLRNLRKSEIINITYNDINFKVIITYRDNNYFITIVRLYTIFLKLYYIYDETSIECILTSHFIERFKERYNNGEKWLLFLVREISPVLKHKSCPEKGRWFRTRHGKTAAYVKHMNSEKRITFFTYVSKFKEYKTLKIPYGLYLFGTYGKD